MDMTEKTFQAPELTLNYAQGPENGPAMLLLHGQGSVWQDWEPVIDHFQPRWHIFAPDFRGCGGSDRSSRGNYALEAFAGDIDDFIQTIIQKPVVIIGHSLGSMVALNIAARDRQGRVKGIVLEDPPLYLTEFFQDWMWYEYFPVSQKVLKAGLNEDQIAAEFVQRLGLTRADAVKEARSLVRIDPQIIDQVMDRSILEGFDPEEELKKITSPLLLVYGQWDLGSAVRPEDVARISPLLPPGSLHQIEGSGHGIHLPNCRPEDFIRSVQEFLERLEPT